MPDTDAGDLYRLMYVSTSSRFLTDAEVDALLAQSRRDNEAAGITGMLIYVDGHFLQYIEGRRAEIAALTARIEEDPRHHGLLRIMEGPSQSRAFPDWSMGYRRLGTDAGEELLGAVNLAQHGVDASLPQNLPRELSVFMESFYNSSLGTHGGKG
jgi:hypothetical protein